MDNCLVNKQTEFTYHAGINWYPFEMKLKSRHSAEIFFAKTSKGQLSEMSFAHRSLSTRTSMYVCAGPAHILGKKYPCKKSADLHLQKGIYYKWTFLQDSTKPLLTTQNRLEASWKKSPFSSTCVFYVVHTKISMVLPRRLGTPLRDTIYKKAWEENLIAYL
jgi:hypothetical protein